jgi:hypothetical protein
MNNGQCFSWGINLLIIMVSITIPLSTTAQVPDPQEFLERQTVFSTRAEAAGLKDPFIGITTNGQIIPGLFGIRSTGVSTAPVKIAAENFLDSLAPNQRQLTIFPADDIEWRRWANQHSYLRDGVSFENMTDQQRDAVFAMLEASLSAKGLKLTRDIMNLNGTLAELKENNYVEYGEWKYWITIMGEPSLTEPWGWQLDGHHLIINYFVLGDQVVMTPSFWGSEPAVATSGKFTGTRVLDAETDAGLEMIRALDADQRTRAILEVSKDGNNILAQAFSDNLIVDYAGISASELSGDQKKLLLKLMGLYVGNLRDEHARMHMSEVEAHIDDTWFSWIGGYDEDAVFYYRIHSPVILIEFDHQTPVALRHLYTSGVPNKEHVHAVVRTPNGNDYGKDLLRQHHEQHPHGEADVAGQPHWH